MTTDPTDEELWDIFYGKHAPHAPYGSGLRTLFNAGFDAGRESVTPDREEVHRAVGGALVNVGNYPEKVQAHMLGRDLTALIAKVTDAVLSALGMTEEGQ